MKPWESFARIEKDQYNTAKGLAGAMLRAKSKDEEEEQELRIHRSAESFEILYEEMKAYVQLAIAAAWQSHAANVRRNYAQWLESTWSKMDDFGNWKYREVGESFGKWLKKFKAGEIEIEQGDEFIASTPEWEN